MKHKNDKNFTLYGVVVNQTTEKYTKVKGHKWTTDSLHVHYCKNITLC